MKTAAVYKQHNHPRSEVVCDIAAAGLRVAGYDVRVFFEDEYEGEPVASIAAFYGMAGKLRQISRDYKSEGHHALYFDLPYWKREGKRPNFGHHKIAVDGRHPTAYFQKVKHTGGRWRTFGLPFRPRVQLLRGAIVVAGMSKKACDFEGYEHEAFEREAIRRLKEVTRRPIVYRPKPTCPFSKPIAGTLYSGPSDSVWKVLERCHAVVARHSNVAVDGICTGSVPCVIDGVASVFSTTIEDIDRAKLPLDDIRMQFLADLAYTQWSLHEIRSGQPFLHLEKEGVI